MDQFYLKHVDRYQRLVKAFKPAPIAPTAGDLTETSSPGMIVSVRIRPLLEEDTSTDFPAAIFPRPAQIGVIDIHDLYNHPRGQPLLKSFNYKVDRVFDSNSVTEEIYKDFVADLVPFAWKGGIGTLFAYGQTGSGKTFTISQLEQLVVESLLQGSFEGKRQVYLSIVELAGNSAFDLLNARSPISVLEDAFGETQLTGATEHMLQNQSQVVELINDAASFRHTELTFRNDTSSRSHGICRIRIVNQSAGSEGVIYLVDLAGSEAARDLANHNDDRMKETREINVSLSVLKDCIRGKVEADALAFSDDPKSKRKKPYVPFRRSALTKVLKHVFDPNEARACKTVVIACVNPSLADVGASKKTLRFAEMLRVMVPATDQGKSNPRIPKTWTNAALKNWIVTHSGSLSLPSAIVAPNESGAHFLRMTADEIRARCLKIPGINISQVQALHNKIWQMHIDSQHANDVADSVGTAEARPVSNYPYIRSNRRSSRDPNSDATGVPFQNRIRPGMVVSWSQHPTHASAADVTEQMDLALILCPCKVSAAIGDQLQECDKWGQADPEDQYMCALTTPGAMPGSYEVNLWRQAVIGVKLMTREVILEYDSPSRYYYLAI